MDRDLKITLAKLKEHLDGMNPQEKKEVRDRIGPWLAKAALDIDGQVLLAFVEALESLKACWEDTSEKTRRRVYRNLPNASLEVYRLVEVEDADEVLFGPWCPWPRDPRKRAETGPT